MENCVQALLIFASSPLIWETLRKLAAVASGGAGGSRADKYLVAIANFPTEESISSPVTSTARLMK
jgi:hypothetical protein